MGAVKFDHASVSPGSPRVFTRLTAVHCAVAAWMAVAVGCTAALFVQSASPGQAGAAPTTRPQWLAAESRAGGSTLVVAVHPRCPCTAATLSNLEDALRRRPATVELIVLSFAPEGAGPDWSTSSTLGEFKSHLGAHIVTDTGGRLARSLGAHTSGHVLFYDQHGALRFSGGVTPSRGHQGDCAPLDALIGLVRQTEAPATASPFTSHVFGCPISTDVCSTQPVGGGCAP